MSRRQVGFFSRILLQKRCACSTYSSACSAVLLDERVNDPIPETKSTCEIYHEDITSWVSREPSLFPLVVRVLKSVDWEAVRKINFSEAVQRYGLSHSLEAFSVIIDILSFAGRPGKVHFLVRQIVSFCWSNNYDTFALFAVLVSAKGSVSTSEALFQAFIKSSLLINALDVFLKAKELDQRLSISSCNSLLKLLAEKNEKDLINSFFTEMDNSGPSPNVYTFTILLEFYCEVDMVLASKFLKAMDVRGLKPTVVTYSTFLHGLCRAGHTDSALAFLQELRMKNISLNHYCYNAIIHGFCREGKLDDAKFVLVKMKEYGLLPDVHTYIISRLCRERKSELAQAVFNLMEERRCHPDVVVYSTLIGGFAKETRLVQANKLYLQMLKYKIKPNAVTYTNLITAFINDHQILNAESIFDQMILKGIEPDVISYTAIISGFCKAWNLKKAREFFQKMEKSGLVPDVVAYTCLINGYCKSQQMANAIALLHGMKTRNVSPNVVTYIALISGLLKDNNLCGAERYCQEMLDEGVLQDPLACLLLDKMLEEALGSEDDDL
ncbi:hypothetical protein H6P81_009738 [Aristolochia fimbriata]|uniref:Pentatricopeptide repeat-containing protein n=1 Tax=Aristolochia fimbriata TaxID=158543 RepID=A0AAV7ELV8_ARIFI|nr:hypothetical protein H6P81_009738 [Aristolochia fimbriata]